ncbi:hypothetical protein SRA_06546 [Streptococcus ratti FA-1 = DSM 20564]|uniref:Transposase n=1 Tax=Streptococcus ratti FA-1 = DSM 20564 TaxID=699248 RepID=A0ABP2QYL5_STRRT|nr:hypothetical protein SRA_06546 [Streptococcus ratti FA-1 = DSM 20564]
MLKIHLELGISKWIFNTADGLRIRHAKLEASAGR